MTNEEAIKMLEQPSTLHGDAIRLAIKALEIADRLEQVDVEEAKNIYCQELSCAGLCDECDHLEDFADGYNKALADIRGEENGK